MSHRDQAKFNNQLPEYMEWNALSEDEHETASAFCYSEELWAGTHITECPDYIESEKYDGNYTNATETASTDPTEGTVARTRCCAFYTEAHNFTLRDDVYIRYQRIKECLE
jgi:hypothetical protein